MSDKPKFVYVTYIASTPEKVWQALTDADIGRAILVRLSRLRRRQSRFVLHSQKPQRQGF